MDKWPSMISFVYLIVYLLSSVKLQCGGNKETNSREDKKLKMTNELLKNIDRKVKNSRQKNSIDLVSANKEIADSIKKKNKLIMDINKAQESLADNTGEDKKSNLLDNNLNTVNKIRKSNDITLSFNDYLLQKNTDFKRQKYLKYTSTIKYIDFCQLDLFRFFAYIRNAYRGNGDYFYELDLKAFNIFFGFNLTLGLDCGFSFIKKDSNKNNVPFMNINIGYKYSDYGHFEIIVGGSRVKYDGIPYWPLWYAITPINISVDLFKFKSSPFGINLNVKVLFKGIITSDMADFEHGFREIDKTKIFPYIGDMSNPNILETFIDLKIFLGFRFFDEF